MAQTDHILPLAQEVRGGVDESVGHRTMTPRRATVQAPLTLAADLVRGIEQADTGCCPVKGHVDLPLHRVAPTQTCARGDGGRDGTEPKIVSAFSLWRPPHPDSGTPWTLRHLVA